MRTVLLLMRVEVMAVAAVLMLGGLVAVLLGPTAAPPNAYDVLDEDLEPFRSEFNRAGDEVRVVLLVGPT